MRLALQTASLRSSSYEKLNVHVIDNSNICGSKFSVSATTARKILITHIIVDEDFDPIFKDFSYGSYRYLFEKMVVKNLIYFLPFFYYCLNHDCINLIHFQ